jgi:hypothetical protein
MLGLSVIKVWKTYHIKTASKNGLLGDEHMFESCRIQEELNYNINL